MPARRNAYYQGPRSDHFDGRVFFNPGRPWTKTPLDLLKWNLSREGKEPWPAQWPATRAPRPEARVEGDRLVLTAIGHASFLLQTAGLNILLDPVWSPRVSPVRFAGPQRVNAPGVAFEELPAIDVVLLTHNHYDHLDVDTLGRLGREHAPRLVTALGNDSILRKAGIAMPMSAHDWGEQIALADGVSVTLAECYHWSARGLFDRRHALWTAFVLETPGGVIYHIGDTGYGDGRPFRAVRERFAAPRLAILPIGAYEPRWFMKDQHVNPDEAVRIMLDTGAVHAAGHHWGTFKLTDEGIERPPQALEVARRQHGVAAERFRPMAPGDVWEVPPA
ncbi:MBL fold metallo-hydrolase [uncultured Alsobacter sp.]|uniref:MBL fold metallo-hydrolase n=1 Tax=uncultured Alsobacter sp. TaxID=1748258 RepID=UPI0025CE972A|nr:MBL fold metallo-hydrolase [uncultured Alsobacter sp.]